MLFKSNANMETEVATAVPAPPSAAHVPQPVSGTNVFWILFVLAITVSSHPLGSCIGFPNDTRRYLRILPFTALFDATLLFIECITYMRRQGHPPPYAARAVFLRRLRASVPDNQWTDNQGDDGHGNPDLNQIWLKALVLFIGTDLRPRFVTNALVVFVYTKIYGYQGTPVSLAIATIYFASWVGMELLVFVAYGLVWSRNLRQIMALADNVADPRPRPWLLSVASKTNLFLVAGQIITTAVFGIWVIATPAPSPSTPATPQPEPEPIWLRFLRFTVSVMNWSFTPAQWYFDRVEPAGLGPLLIPLRGFPGMILAMPSVVITLLTFFSPIWLPLYVLFWVTYLVAHFGPRITLGLQGVPPVFWARVGSAVLLSGVLVYYLKFWDSTGTEKAPWSEHLG
ncbi:hypothetical protein B0T18DRAFT_490845 [Schizothecium vesticola]|uniref:Uncharacterized protein n=1 Tax=Schizothecium vesticola TaxID=314040 RepID=A0AA40EID8_9PEZI|nr:hypothetical protein B0T18DRAFT_490845 [Schizothecium vesticola]